MKVGFFADKLNIDRGGSNFSLDLMARALSERGHEVAIVTVNFAHENVLPASYPYEVIESPIENRTRFGDAREIRGIFRQHTDRFDLYHVFNPALLPVAGWFRRDHEVPVVGRLNNFDIFCTNLAMMDGECHNHCTTHRKFQHSDAELTTRFMNVPKYAFDTAVLPRAMSVVDKLFALSPQVQTIYEGIGVASDRFEVIPNFYDPAFADHNPGPNPFASNRPILYVGNLRSHKGVEQLVECARSLPSDVSIEIVGTGPSQESLEQHVDRLGVDDIVTFHGWVSHDDLPAYYNAAEVFVHPGHWPEPFNRTLLEAMQYDTPLIVSDIGAPPWVVGDCGLTFDRGDAESLRNTLVGLLSDDDERERLRRNCSSRLDSFSPERVVSLIEDQYEAVT